MTQLAEAHIVAQQQLRDLTQRSVEVIWRNLLGYDDKDVPTFLRQALPLVAGAQRHSVALTDAWLARELGRRPLGVNPARATGAAVRNGTPPEDVYRRPFVTVWSALKQGADYADAVEQGLARLRSTAGTDVQLAMRTTLREAGQADDRIVGYARVPDGGACAFCQLVSGQRYTTEDLMPIHNNCGCGVDVITGSNRHEFTGNRRNDLDVPIEGDGIAAAVREHGELGPVLVDAQHDFTGQQQLAA